VLSSARCARNVYKVDVVDASKKRKADAISPDEAADIKTVSLPNLVIKDLLIKGDENIVRFCKWFVISPSAGARLRMFTLLGLYSTDGTNVFVCDVDVGNAILSLQVPSKIYSDNNHHKQFLNSVDGILMVKHRSEVHQLANYHSIDGLSLCLSLSLSRVRSLASSSSSSFSSS
jgi:hypothetical protein